MLKLKERFMKGIVDIHNHILYHVDDGSQSINESIKMLKSEYEQGVRQVILTPHFCADEYMIESSKIMEQFNKLKSLAGEKVPDLILHIGQEIMAGSDTIELLEKKKVFTMAGSRYVLIEFYPSASCSLIEKYVQELVINGYSPIIAHCERYNCFHAIFNRIDKIFISHIVEMGAYIQVNIDSLFGRNGHFVSQLINEDKLHFIASDAHNIHNRGVYWERGIRYLEKKYNNKYIKWLLTDNPMKVINNEYI